MFQCSSKKTYERGWQNHSSYAVDAKSVNTKKTLKRETVHFSLEHWNNALSAHFSLFFYFL